MISDRQKHRDDIRSILHLREHKKIAMEEKDGNGR